MEKADMNKVSVLFVCLGNICRSPTAQGVFEKFVDEAGLQAKISVDSAGTSTWHIGAPPDSRSAAAALQAGYDISRLRGRKVVAEDFSNFDYVLAMDEANLVELEEIRPANFQGHLGLFLDFSADKEYREVPDPYHGTGEGFRLVLTLIEGAAKGLLNHIKKTSVH